ncbi:MAG: hypothetical protein ACOY45_09495 [Pseudomonadota bacterium]
MIEGEVSEPNIGVLSSAGSHPVATCIAENLRLYAEAGDKGSGGSADQAIGEWLDRELRSLGYACARQGFAVPYFTARCAKLAVAGRIAAVLPQMPVLATGPQGISAPLVHIDDETRLAGAIALIPLPFGRWSTILNPAVSEPLARATAAGAVAAVLVTTGPSGEALALNAPAGGTPARIPVAILAPSEARWFRGAARRRERATLTLAGAGGNRTAFNLSATIDRGKARWVIASTPRSGWFACAGERGPGVAIWIELARWARTALPEFNLAFHCTSGHEFEYLGAKLLLEKGMVPAPEQTALWITLGANIATRDWHQAGGALHPLPSADTNRFLLASPDLLRAAATAFAGEPGLERPYPADAGAQGELADVLAAGYRAAGIFGAHRYHHARGDTLRCVEPALVEAVANRLKGLILAAIAPQTRIRGVPCA